MSLQDKLKEYAAKKAFRAIQEYVTPDMITKAVEGLVGRIRELEEKDGKQYKMLAEIDSATGRPRIYIITPDADGKMQLHSEISIHEKITQLPILINGITAVPAAGE